MTDIDDSEELHKAILREQGFRVEIEQLKYQRDAAFAAGRKAGLEEAAKVCEERRDDWNKHVPSYSMGDAAEWCADDIRARIEQGEKK